ncbi:MAG: peptidylprolyl isomerase [Phycisphaerales bacterium]|nr:peptidylprolyl isomerase [Phycisphaerales bacterium]
MNRVRAFAFGVISVIGLTVSGNGLAASAGEPAQAAPSASLQPKVEIETTLGEFVVELDAERAPVSAMNFIDYANDGYYSGTVFHRVVKGRMIHGGGYTADLQIKTKGLRDPIRYEGGNGLLNRRGTIASYRRFDDLKSAQSQFYVNTADNDQLDLLRDGSSYVVFGRVVEGMDVIDRINDVSVGPRPGFAAGLNPFVPVEPVVIKSMLVVAPLDRPTAEAKAKANLRAAEMTLETRIEQIENEAKSSVVESKSGLRYIDRKVGNGAFPNPDDTVEVNYQATLLNGAEFDSSKSRGEGVFALKVSDMIRGLREGMVTMRESGQRVFIVPPELGFGMDGVPGKVPPGATLFYEVELVSVRPPTQP